MLDAVSRYLGNTGPAELNWRSLFSGVFAHHTVAEAEAIFIQGTATTTPDPLTVGRTWPRPWLYSRVFLLFAIVYGLLLLCTVGFDSLTSFPGLLVVGAFAVPFTTLVLFLELNVWRNISLHRVVQLFGAGGVASIVCSLFLFGVFEVEWGSWQATSAAFIEEPGKALIVLLAMRWWLKTPNRLLNGLLVGAAVGAGFAAFESAGYAFGNFVNLYGASVLEHAGTAMQAARSGPEFLGGVLGTLAAGSMEASYQNILLRALLAPGGHVAWAAIHGAGFAVVAREKRLDFSAFANPKYLRLAAIPVGFHFLWNSPVCDGLGTMANVVLVAAVWVVVLFLVNRGLAEVGRGEHSRIA